MKNNFVLTLFVLFSAFFATSCCSNNEKCSPQGPLNVVLMIGDGMSIPQIYALTMVEDTPTAFERFSYSGLAVSKSASNEITDSAAGGTAIATGHKTRNHMIGMDADSVPVPSLLEIMAEKGKKTGVVVTSYVSHATPASFIAHCPNRNNYEDIAMQISERTDVDVLIGGGKKHFINRKDSVDLLEKMSRNGWVVCDSLEQVSDLNARTAVLADMSHMKRVSERGDFLPKATSLALDMLSNDDGFFLMVEGSQIDFAGHNNDSTYLVDEMRDFNKTIGVVLDFAEKNPNTLVIVTADHETGGLTLIDEKDKYTNVEFKFSTGSHSPIFVPVFAFGPGAEQLSGIMDNTDIMRKVLDLMK
ncbi:MAG: alkaline phosphatase [Candidatus Limimorpha sp.]